MRYSTLLNIIILFTISCASPGFHDEQEMDKSFLVLDVNNEANWQFWQVTIDGITYKNSLAHGKKSYLPIYAGHRKIHICLEGLISLKPFDGTYIKLVCEEELDNLFIFPNYGGYYKIDKQSVYIVKSIPLETSYTWKKPTLSIDTILSTIFLPMWPIGWFAGFSPKYTQLYAYELVLEKINLGDDAKMNLEYLGVLDEKFRVNYVAKIKNFVKPKSIYYISTCNDRIIAKAIPTLEFNKNKFGEQFEPIVVGFEIIDGESNITKGSKIWASKQ